MWIKKNEKCYYNDSKYHGLKLVFYEGFIEDEKDKIIRFCNWLIKTYWFPIKCYLRLVHQKKFKAEDGHSYYGIFYSNEEYKPRRYPCVFIAAQIDDDKDEDFCYFCIAHELSHYFQWFFFENEKKSDRSLEIMASKWARYIVNEFRNQIEKDIR